MTDDDFRILLIEDNDGDAVLIERYLERVDDNILPRKLVLEREPSLSKGLDVLHDGSRDMDLLLLDLGLPETSGMETLHRVLDEFDDLPVVVLTGLDDRRTAVRAIREGAQDYLNKDKIDVEDLGRALRYAIERRKRQKKAERREELRRMVHEVLVESSTRDSIEKTFCERMVDQEPYVFACISVPDADATLRVSSSSDADAGYFEHLLSSGIPEDAEPTPTVRAAREREAVFVQNINNMEESWAEAAAEDMYMSVASIPLVYGGVLYGVLSVYSDIPDFFDSVERDVLSDVVDSLSYSINIAGKEKALTSNKTTEVKIGLDPSVSYLSDIVEQHDEAEVSVKDTIPTDSGVVQFVDIEGLSSGTINTDDNDLQGVKNVNLLHDGEATERYRFTVTGPTPESYLLNLGVVVHSIDVSEEGVNIRVEIPSEKDIGNVVNRVKSKFGSATVMMCRDVSSAENNLGRRLRFDEDRLTDKQSEALKTAYYQGYFEQPKKNSAEDIASTLDVSRSTFLQHLRTSQKKVFGGLFEQ